MARGLEPQWNNMAIRLIRFPRVACTRKGQPKGNAQVPLNGRIPISMQNGNTGSGSGTDTYAGQKEALTSAHATGQCYRNGNLWRETELTHHHVTPDALGVLSFHEWFFIVYIYLFPLLFFFKIYMELKIF